MSLIAVDKTDFESAVLDGELPAMVLFFNEAKQSSINMLAVFEEAAKDLGGKVSLFKKKYVGNGSSENAYGVESAPTTVFFKEGKKVGELVGYYQYQEGGTLRRKINELFGV